MEYRLATRVGSGPVRHVLEVDRMVVVYEKAGRHDEVLFTDICEINLRQELPGACTVRIVRAKGMTITIPARHFEALGQFEDRGAEYREFVKRLHLACRAANPRIRFVAGSNGLYWLGWILVVFGGLLGALIVWRLVQGGAARPRLPVFVGVVVMFFVGGALIKNGRAKTYDPESLPAKMLPRQG